jgi:outer membrane biosynthesis protein TonB
MKNLRLFLLTSILFLFFFGTISAKNPENHKSKSSFHPCPVNASAGKRANVRMTTIRKKGKPAPVRKEKTVKQKTIKTKTVKQKTVKTKTVKQKTEKVKTEKQPKVKTEKQPKVKNNRSHPNSYNQKAGIRFVGKKTTSKHMTSKF